MTKTKEHPHIGVDLGEKKIIPDTNELVLDGGLFSSKMLKVSLLLIFTRGGNRHSALGSLFSQKSLCWRFICSARLPPFSLLHSSHRPPDVVAAARLAGNIRRASRIPSCQPANRPVLSPWEQLLSSSMRANSNPLALRHYSVSQCQTSIKEDEQVLDGGDEQVLDGGFSIPETNAFGQTFRDYNAESERKKTVEEFYRTNHIYQSYAFVKRMREEYGKLNRVEMSIWECVELLNEFVDDSDPDLDEPQIEHLLQTAEAIRKDYPNDDWLHLTGLIHDLGKVLLHPSFGELPQWAVVGDTFPVGCAFDESNVHHKFFEGNSDYHNPMYNTKYGVYSEGCGLENVLMSWGHDDYMYLVAKENKTTLPSAALFIIRYHSFYPLHRFGAYSYLMNEEDKENLKWLHVFNKYDLYSKSKVRIDVEKVKPYYLSLIEKYFPAKLKW